MSQHNEDLILTNNGELSPLRCEKRMRTNNTSDEPIHEGAEKKKRTETLTEIEDPQETLLDESQFATVAVVREIVGRLRDEMKACFMVIGRQFGIDPQQFSSLLNQNPNTVQNKNVTNMAIQTTMSDSAQLSPTPPLTTPTPTTPILKL